MKLSNKLLLGLCAFLCLTVISGMGFASMNMVITKVSAPERSAPHLETKILAASYTSTSLALDGAHVSNYTLDPNQSSIIAKGEAKVLEQLIINEGGILTFSQVAEGNLRASNIPVAITIGIKDKENLSIHLSHDAQLNTVDILRNDMMLMLEDNAEAILHTEADTLMVIMSDDTKLNLVGKSDRLFVNVEDEVKIVGEGFYTDKLEVNMENRSLVKLGKARNITGDMEDKAVLHFEQPCVGSKVKRQDKAIITYGSGD